MASMLLARPVATTGIVKPPASEAIMKKKPPVERFNPNREYKFDRAMQDAARRSASHPKPISMTTKVGEFAHVKR